MDIVEIIRQELAAEADEQKHLLKLENAAAELRHVQIRRAVLQQLRALHAAGLDVTRLARAEQLLHIRSARHRLPDDATECRFRIDAAITKAIRDVALHGYPQAIGLHLHEDDFNVWGPVVFELRNQGAEWSDADRTAIIYTLENLRADRLGNLFDFPAVLLGEETPDA